MKKNTKIIIISIISIIVLATILFFSLYFYLNPRRNTISDFQSTLNLDTVLSSKQALNDLDYFYGILKSRHPLWLDGSKALAEQITSMYIESSGDFSTPQAVESGVTVLELWRTYSRILSIIHDAHTMTWFQSENQRFINDFTQAMAGYELVSIDGVSQDILFDTFKSLFSWETESSVKNTFSSSYILSEHYLNLCGIDTSDGANFTWLINGKNEDFHYNFVNGADIIFPKDADGNNSDSNENDDFVEYTIDDTENIGILTLSSCICDEHYIQTVSSFFDEVLSHKITNIAVDLRGNGGGSSSVANEFLRHIDVEKYNSWDCSIRYGWFLLKNKNIVYKNKKYNNAFSGNLYILTDIKTFSAAMDFAMLVSDNNLGKIIGEASGNNPESYGDCLYFQMPESKIAMQISFKKWYRVNKSKSGQLIEPDYPCSSPDAISTLKAIISK